MREKRRQILDGVRQVMGERGILGVTMKNVASAADMSQGLLHYYFSSKDEMMLEVMRTNSERVLDLFGQALRSLQPGDDVPGFLTREYRRLHDDYTEYFTMFAECWPLIWTGQAMRQAIRELFLYFRGGVRGMLEDLRDRGVIEPQLPLGDLAAMINAQCDGMELQMHVDPALAKSDGFWRAFEHSLRALFNGKWR